MLFTVITVAFGPAFAQELPPAYPEGGGFDAHGFRLVALDSDARDPLGVVRPGTLTAGDAYAGGVFEYAWRPLVFDLPSGEEVVALRDVVALDLAAGWTAHERLRLDVGMPVFVSSTGVLGAQGAALGDLRLGGLLGLVLPQDTDGIGLGAFGAVDLPTGREDRWLGESGVAGLLGLATTWEGDQVTLTGSLAGRAAPNTAPEERPAPALGHDTFQVGAAVGYLVAANTSLGLEGLVDVPFTPVGRDALGVPTEVRATVRHVRADGAHVAAALGTAIGGGAGASPLRLVLGGGFGNVPAPVDTDADGIVDREDACPGDPETANGLRDEDGCPDAVPRLTVRAVQGQAERGDARVVAVRADGTELVGTGALVGQAMPGDLWLVTATAGNCLAGKRELVAPPNDVTFDVPLERRDGTVAYAFATSDGKPLDQVTVRYAITDPDCAPADTKAHAPMTLHEVGPGTHTVYVEAPGYAVWRGTIEVQPDAVTNVQVRLAPTMAVLEADQIRILDKVYFETGLAVIQARSHPLLSEVANLILVHDLKGVEVQGHTDNQGPDDFNLKLSQDRANAVRQFLIDAGVPAERLTAIGFGETRPIASNTKEAGRSQNRRVEFRIQEPATVKAEN